MTAASPGTFAGRVAFITGAGAGIGRATALAFAREGASVAAADISDSTEETAILIEKAGGRAISLRCDVTREDQVKAALDRTATELGQLDFAFNNAGIEQPIAETIDLAADDWDRIMAVNLRDVFLCMKHEIPLMRRRGGGSIVNTSSGAGVRGFSGQAAYVAAKHGVVGLTRSAALDYASANIRVNAICPGIIETPMMGRFTGGTDEGRQRVISQEPIGRMGRPEEIAAAVMWLCSDLAAFAVGAAIVVDGGQTV